MSNPQQQTPQEYEDTLVQVGEELGYDARCIVGGEQTSMICEELTPQGWQHHFYFATPENLDWDR